MSFLSEQNISHNPDGRTCLRVPQGRFTDVRNPVNLSGYTEIKHSHSQPRSDPDSSSDCRLVRDFVVVKIKQYRGSVVITR